MTNSSSSLYFLCLIRQTNLISKKPSTKKSSENGKFPEVLLYLNFSSYVLYFLRIKNQPISISIKTFLELHTEYIKILIQSP